MLHKPFLRENAWHTRVGLGWLKQVAGEPSICLRLLTIEQETQTQGYLSFESLVIEIRSIVRIANELEGTSESDGIERSDDGESSPVFDPLADRLRFGDARKMPAKPPAHFPI